MVEPFNGRLAALDLRENSRRRMINNPVETDEGRMADRDGIVFEPFVLGGLRSG